MRIQILPLPTAFVVDETNEPPLHRITRHETTPFVLVIDRCSSATLHTLRYNPQLLEALQHDFGAAAWFLGDLEEIELPGALALPPALQAQLAEHLATTLKENP